MTTLSRGFPPLAAQSSRVLVLGTLPGQASLQAAQYYAQPRNAFWPLMGEMFGAGPALPYEVRTRRLVGAGVAVWDVCAAAHRNGSLDTAIERASIRVNDFAAFLAAHPGIRAVAFNGRLAGELFHRRVWPQLRSGGQVARSVTLPSTSPAHASLSFADKHRHWLVLRELAGC